MEKTDKYLQQACIELAEQWNLTAPDPTSTFDAQKEALIKLLAPQIEERLLKNPQKLMNDFYRLDIDEEKTRRILKSDQPLFTIGEDLARLVVERELQKVVTRKQAEEKKSV